ncbi:hypothetical protein Tco_0952857 [Tanacetum coccineum]|uniref:Uncharacterized protein n=1 Tax=Tanacetum coccineum TaxID=301880 RepID=A0ABQ5DY69_9ASTR
MITTYGRGQWIIHQCLQRDDMHKDDHGSYDTLIQDQMAMPYGSVFSKSSFVSAKEEIYLILLGIGDEFINVYACTTALERWEAKKGSKGESLKFSMSRTKRNFGSLSIHLSRWRKQLEFTTKIL